MTRDQIAASVIATVLKFEGGIADVGDGKGVTRFGQTPDWLNQFGLAAPSTAAEAAANYRAWLDVTGLIALCDVADLLAEVTIDWAVHSGHGRPIRALQAAIGTRPDGVIGERTEAAIAELTPAQRQKGAAKVMADRVRHAGKLITDDPAEYARWAKGWANRHAELIERLA